MKRCERCKTGKLEKTVALDSVEVGKHVFTARVPVLKCRKCGEVHFDGPSLERFELQVAVELAKAGEARGEVMRFMRKAAGLRAQALAALSTAAARVDEPLVRAAGMTPRPESL